MKMNFPIKMDNKFALIFFIFCNILLGRYSTLADSGEGKLKFNILLKLTDFLFEGH